MQNWTRIYSYIEEYQRLIYDVYSKDSVAFLCTYYNINQTETVWENEDLLGGAYEKIGDLSGIKWNKFLLLPVYFMEEISTAFDGQDIGYNKENESTLVIPSSYGIIPLPNDLVKLEQSYLKPTSDTYPIFTVSGVEVDRNTDKRFWKLKIITEQSRTTNELERLNESDDHIATTYTFFDYDKKIHTVEDAAFLTRLLTKNETIKDNLKSNFDDNSGFYLL